MKKKISITDAQEWERRLDVLRDAADRGILARGARGIEKESLRVAPDGSLAVTAHPAALGAALTHPELTTDYSEALLEFITPPVSDAAESLASLRTLHRFVHHALGDELLWDLSMPGELPPDASIPIADYGVSNLGRFKHVYRRGLAVRYGRAMQCIAGIHYNFSLPEALWPTLAPAAMTAAAPDDPQSAGYMHLIRNYRRFSWLLLYLFGASPVLDRSFFRDRPDLLSADGRHGLDRLDNDTLFLPHATSLRMSDLGYHNRVNDEMRQPDLSSLRGYLDDLRAAIRAPHAPYAALGTHRDGEWIQLNTNFLQIENELYATIRPKRVSDPNERILDALTRRGIEYVEVRCLDVDPFEDIGIGETTVRFLDAFLTMCALDASPDDARLQREADVNFIDVAKDGRRAGKSLRCDGAPTALTAWADRLLARVEAVAQVLDRSRGDGAHMAAVHAQRVKLAAPAMLPSARVLAATEAAGSFAAFGLRQSRLHAQVFRSEPLPPNVQARLSALAAESHARQARLEADDAIDFDTFVARFGSAQTALQNA